MLRPSSLQHYLLYNFVRGLINYTNVFCSYRSLQKMIQVVWLASTLGLRGRQN